MLKPLSNYVLLEPLEEKGLIIQADTSKAKPEKGKVLAIGDEVEVKGFKVGDVILFRVYAEESYEYEGKQVYMIEDKDLMGVWHESA